MKIKSLIAVAVVAASAGCMGPGAGNGVAASDAGKPLRVAVFVGGGARNIGAFRWLELTARAKNVVARLLARTGARRSRRSSGTAAATSARARDAVS